MDSPADQADLNWQENMSLMARDVCDKDLPGASPSFCHMRHAASSSRIPPTFVPR
jgi:hypothetical protein